MAEIETSNDITSGKIASAVKDAATAEASPAQRTPAPGPADASTRETPGAPANGDDKYKGWIPPDAHKHVVDGMHKRLDSVAWANGLSRAEVEEALAIRRQLAERGTRGQEPQPDARDERGELFYTPKQAAAWAAWQAEQIVSQRMQEFDARIAPIEQREQSFAQTRELEGQIQTATQWPGFMEHVEVVTKAIQAANATGQKLTLHEAYIQHVVPKLSDLSVAKQKWLAELNDTTAKTNNEINPGRTPSRSRKKDSEMSIGELYADEIAKRKAS